MIIVESKTPMLLFRFKSYKNHDFIKSHNTVLQNIGSVWMMKAGKQSSIDKIDKVRKSGGWMILRSPKGEGSKSYLAQFSEFSEKFPSDKTFPSYYQEIIEEENDDIFSYYTEYQWFRLTRIHPLTEEQVSDIVLSNSQQPINGIIGTTRTAVMFVENAIPITIEE